MRTATTAPAVEAFDHRSVVRYTVITTIVGFALMTAPALVGLPSEVGILLTTYGLLLGGSVVTAHRAGPGGIRRLFRGVLRWRIGWGNAAVVVGAIPLATIAVAVVTGAYVAPPGGWLPVVGSYLFTTFVLGALVLNLWEETGWHGMIQRHLMGRHGLVKGALLTAVPFAVIHIPLSVRGTSNLREAVVNVGAMFLMAPAARYLVGRADIATGGSLLAVGVLHASWNASGNLTVVDGDWQHIAGVLSVAVITLVVDLARSRFNARISEGHGTPHAAPTTPVT